MKMAINWFLVRLLSSLPFLYIVVRLIHFRSRDDD